MKTLFLPYVRGVSERIERVCRSLNVNVVFKSSSSLRQTLTRMKTRRDKELRRGVVYEVPCGGCSSVYFVETGRLLQERLKEYAVKTANMNNGITAHAWNHQIPWTGTQQGSKCLNNTCGKERYLKLFALNRQGTPTPAKLRAEPHPHVSYMRERLCSFQRSLYLLCTRREFENPGARANQRALFSSNGTERNQTDGNVAMERNGFSVLTILQQNGWKRKLFWGLL